MQTAETDADAGSKGLASDMIRRLHVLAKARGAFTSSRASDGLAHPRDEDFHAFLRLRVEPVCVTIPPHTSPAAIYIVPVHKADIFGSIVEKGFIPPEADRPLPKLTMIPMRLGEGTSPSPTVFHKMCWFMDKHYIGFGLLFPVIFDQA